MRLFSSCKDNKKAWAINHSDPKEFFIRENQKQIFFFFNLFHGLEKAARISIIHEQETILKQKYENFMLNKNYPPEEIHVWGRIWGQEPEKDSNNKSNNIAADNIISRCFIYKEKGHRVVIKKEKASRPTRRKISRRSMSALGWFSAAVSHDWIISKNFFSHRTKRGGRRRRIVKKQTLKGNEAK